MTIRWIARLLAVVGFLLPVLTSASLTSASATADALADNAAKSSASDLAARLTAAPPASSWVADGAKESAYQADVNRMAYLSSLLAGELANGKGREETRSIYAELRSVGLRILTRSKATGQKLPAAEVEAYEQLMSKLEAWYGPPAASAPKSVGR